jgi:UDP-N-acetylmuramate dehydrogenase
MSLRAWCEKNAAQFSGVLLFEEPLSRHTYYRIGGPAELLAQPRSVEDLSWLHQALLETGARSFLLGFGSNILAHDDGFRGVVIGTRKLDLTVTELASGRVRTGAGVAISTFLRRASEQGWGGLEFLTGIPGSIGGAVRMNGGTHLGESSSALDSVEVFSLKSGLAREVSGEELRFQYRKNLFLGPDDLVVGATWRYQEAAPSEVKARIDSTLLRRKETQPLDAPSCGSVFKNPLAHGMQAWQVVDRLGLRGHRIGNAQISPKHSNWIVNLGEAKAADVRALIEEVKRRAQNELGIPMEEEVVGLGP